MVPRTVTEEELVDVGEDIKWWLAQTMETLKRLYFVFAMAERVKTIEAGVSVALPGGE